MEWISRAGAVKKKERKNGALQYMCMGILLYVCGFYIEAFLEQEVLEGCSGGGVSVGCFYLYTM